jgi:hypothetical protein
MTHPVTLDNFYGQALSEDQIRHIDRMCTLGLTDHRVALAVRCSKSTVLCIRRQLKEHGLEAVLESRRNRPIERPRPRAEITPPHITAERWTPEWWDENNAAFEARLLETGEWPRDRLEKSKPQTYVNMGGLR